MVGVILGGTAAPAAGQAVSDASCAGPRETPVTPMMGTDIRFAQTFVAQNSGALTAGQADISKASSTGNYVMRIQDVDPYGTPTNNLLASATIPDSSVPMGDSILTANFASPAAVTEGQQYALIVTRPGSGLTVGARTGNDCPGAFYASPSQTGAFQGSSDLDLVFTVFVEPARPAARTLTLDTDKSKVRKGRRVLLFGQVDTTATQVECESAQTVALQSKRPKQTEFTTFAEIKTDPQGGFSLRKKLRKTSEFRAQVLETAGCGAGFSDTEKVKVKKARAR